MSSAEVLVLYISSACSPSILGFMIIYPFAEVSTYSGNISTHWKSTCLQQVCLIVVLVSRYVVSFRSGKSTYLQQVCLIVILAQIGCYVPAHFSTLRVVDRIFTRMGAVDNLESNSSTVQLTSTVELVQLYIFFFIFVQLYTWLLFFSFSKLYTWLLTMWFRSI